MNFVSTVARDIANDSMSASMKTSLKRQMDAWHPNGVMWRKFAYAGAAEFPEWFRKYTPPMFGTAFFAAMPKLRRTVSTTQAKLLGLEPGSVAARFAAHKMYVEFAHCLTDALEMSGKPERITEFDRFYVNE